MLFAPLCDVVTVIRVLLYDVFETRIRCSVRPARAISRALNVKGKGSRSAISAARAPLPSAAWVLALGTVTRLEAAPLTAAQQRIINAAHELFAEYGISGTSLQMIATAVGVTKAAVYHQFKTKEEIVLAATTAELLTLQEAIDAAEVAINRAEALDMLVTEIVDRAVKRRRRVALLQSDPVMVRVLANHEPFRSMMSRLYGLLIGEDDADTRVQAAMLASAIGAAVTHPLVSDLDDDVLRAQMMKFAQRLIAHPPG